MGVLRFQPEPALLEDLLAEREITASHETIQFWTGKPGQQYGKGFCRNPLDKIAMIGFVCHPLITRAPVDDIFALNDSQTSDA